jgi:hypothetical protein
MRDRHRGRQRQMMPLERVGAFTLACVAVGRRYWPRSPTEGTPCYALSCKT